MNGKILTVFYPLLFQPVYKDYIWGGRNFKKLFGRTIPNGQVAESWDIAAHKDGTSIVANGSFSGISLSQMLASYGTDLVGLRSEWALARNKFPLLIKLLDAQERLSVQVHPSDEYAQRHEGNELGKTEMWVVLNSLPGSEVILGVTKDTTPSTFKEAIEDGTLDEFLHRIPVKSGDFICVPSGSLHAILGGLVLAEIQQNSNTTYRVFDWGRDLTDRPLHIRQAMDVVNFEQVEPALTPPVPLQSAGSIDRELLCENEYFTVERWYFDKDSSYLGSCDGSTMEIWGIINGQISIEGGAGVIELRPVKFSLLPAALGSFSIKASQKSILLRTYVKQSK
jgi:mannose-6-phosphate isomerase